MGWQGSERSSRSQYNTIIYQAPKSKETRHRHNNNQSLHYLQDFSRKEAQTGTRQQQQRKVV